MAPFTSTSEFAAVCAAPDDDGPRLVLADALSEAGDPRGEFITLQVGAGRRGAKGLARQREKALIVAHGQSWAPRGLTDVVFTRGFVSAGSLWGEADPTDPTWQLVERLSLSEGRGAALLEVGLQSLSSLEGLRQTGLDWMLRGSLRPRLLTLSTVGLEPLELVRKAGPFLPNLVKLVCDDIPQSGEPQLDALLRAVPAGLRRLRVPAAELDLKRALALLARLRPSLALELSYGRCAIELSGGKVRRSSLPSRRLDTIAVWVFASKRQVAIRKSPETECCGAASGKSATGSSLTSLKTRTPFEDAATRCSPDRDDLVGALAPVSPRHRLATIAPSTGSCCIVTSVIASR